MLTKIHDWLRYHLLYLLVLPVAWGGAELLYGAGATHEIAIVGMAVITIVWWTLAMGTEYMMRKTDDKDSR